MQLRSFFVLLFLVVFTSADAQLFVADSTIMAEIDRLDMIDGKTDYIIYDRDSFQSHFLTETFIYYPVKIMQSIARGNLQNEEKKQLREYLFNTIKTIQPNSFSNASFWNRKFKQIYKLIKNSADDERLLAIAEGDIKSSINNITWFNGKNMVDSFLVEANYFFPDEVLRVYDDFQYSPRAKAHVIAAAKYAPQTVKRYLIGGNPILQILRSSDDTIIKTILKINQQAGKKSQAFTVVDEIAKGKSTIEEIDSIYHNKRLWLKKLIQLRAQKNIAGVYSLDKELEETALKFVRDINDRHNDPDAVRFACVNGFSAAELYTLIVYSEEEIFTSTFNGLFNRLLLANGKMNGYKLIESVDENKFRVFIKQCASFGKLQNFLLTMTAPERSTLLNKFVSGLEKPNSYIGEAVEVADAFVSVTDSTTRKLLVGFMQQQLNCAIETNNTKGKTIYTLLLSLIQAKDMFNSNWYADITNKYKIQHIDKIALASLKENNQAVVWQLYFYDDEDGEVSYSSFIKTFTDPNWKIDKQDSVFVKITSIKGEPIMIFANKPKHEYDGQEKVENVLYEAGLTPDVLIHRGHSYYAPKTVEKTKPSAKIFILGSCGGYNLLSSVIERSPDISIISSKQIGSYAVNNPVIKALAEEMRQGKDIVWQNVWNKLDASLKNSPAYSKFVDYIPPHKNLGAIFIKAYMNSMSGEE